MNNEKLVTEIHKVSVLDNIESYRDLLQKLPRDQAKDPYWIKLLEFYDRASEDDKELLFQVMQQVATDSIASFLSLIDGVSYSNLDEELNLTNSNGDVLSGELADKYLEIND